MIITRKITGVQNLADFLRGTPVSSGSQGTNTAASPNLQDSTGNGGFADVVVGDRFYISGESTATTFLVLVKTDDNNVTLDNNIVNANTANGLWRAVKNNAHDASSLSVGPSPIGPDDAFLVAYDSATFGV